MQTENTTDATNSETATPTGSNDQTASDTSTTEAKPDGDAADDGDPPADAKDGEDKGEVDPLDGNDGIAAEPKKEGDEADGEKADAPTFIGAPEGDYELTLPEGMTLDTEALAAFTPVAKEVGLSNEGLSKLASEAYPVVEAQVQKGLVANVVAQRKEWETSARTAISGGKDAEGNAVPPDPIYAGDTHDVVMSTAAKAIDRFGGDALYPNAKFENGKMVDGTFRDFLKTTGLSQHPAMVRAFYLAGKSISEDTSFERGGNVHKATVSREEKYYPNMAT